MRKSLPFATGYTFVEIQDHYWTAKCSSKSSHATIIEDHSVLSKLVVDTLPLEVVVPVVIDVTVDNGLPHVGHPEDHDEGERKSSPVAG